MRLFFYRRNPEWPHALDYLYKPFSGAGIDETDGHEEALAYWEESGRRL